MIEINKLTIQFQQNRTPLFDQVNLCIGSGEKVLFIGPSGSGKSILLKTIMGILPESYVREGEFKVDEKSMTYHSYCHHPIHRKFSTIFQDAVNSLHPYRNIVKQLPDLPEKMIQEACKSFRLQYHHIANEFPKNLSGGQCQRISMLFPYLLDDSRHILVFDEPITDIDPISRKTILQLIKNRFLNQSSKTVIYVTHQHDELKDIKFHRYVIDNNQLIDEGQKQ